MERYNISVEIKNKPVLDPDFMPLLRYDQEFENHGAKLFIGINQQQRSSVLHVFLVLFQNFGFATDSYALHRVFYKLP